MGLSPLQGKGNRCAAESSFSQVRLLFAISLLCLFFASVLAILAAPVPTSKPSTYPAWWFTRDVIAQKPPTNSSPTWPSNYPASDDYVVITQGQLKNLATQAYNELQAKAPTSVWTKPQGLALSAMVTGWNPASGDAYAVVNLGQFKAVAKPFYDVLILIGYATSYPWTGIAADDYSVVNIGQVKNAFSFDVGLDSEIDDLPDWWETHYFGQLGLSGGALAPNGSGLTYLQSYQQGIDPRAAAPFSISIATTGPYEAPANPVIVANISHPATTTIQHVDFYVNGAFLISATSAPWNIQGPNLQRGSYIFKAVAYDNTGATATASTQVQVTQSNYYQRGLGFNNVYRSTVVAVDAEKGVLLDEAQGNDTNNNYTNLFGSNYPWFLRTKGESSELWQHIASVPISTVNTGTGVLTASANHGLLPGQRITISGTSVINGTFLVGSVPVLNQLTLKTTSGGTVTLSGTYNGTGAIASATFNVVPRALGVDVGGAPPLVAFGSQWPSQGSNQVSSQGGTPLYTNQNYRFGVAAGGQLAFAPITISSITGTSPNSFTLTSTSGLHSGQMIVVNGGAGNLTTNGNTFLIGTITGTTTTLTTPTGTLVSGVTGYTSGSANVTSADIKVEVYTKTSFDSNATKVAPVWVQGFTLPRTSNASAWSNFIQNGYVQDYPIGTANGNVINFDTQVQFLPGDYASDTWNQQVNYAMLVTHKAANQDYCYKVSYLGVTTPDNGTGALVTSNSSDAAMAVDSGGMNQVFNVGYTLDFITAPAPWTAAHLQPNFQGTPLPSAYQGKSVDELIHNAPPVADTLPAPSSSGTITVTGSSTVSLDLIHLDNSPELRDHPVLDQFVTSMNNDPMALANYVLNQIRLTDAVGYDTQSGQIADTSINPQGVSRDALATYLEGQGSPAEQCALLVYLLRQCKTASQPNGIPCGYVFPRQDQTLMFDEQLSKLLRMQIRGATNSVNGMTAPELIPVNYPWVAAYITDPATGISSWVHIFPWLKDTSVTEGADVWSYLPSSSTTSGQTFGYQTGGQWLLHYMLNDPAIRQLTTPDGLYTDDMNTLFPLFAQSKLNGTGVSFDQVGMQIYDRQNYYTRWQDFPRPWQTPTVSNTNLAMNLDVSQNPSSINGALANIFDTINIQVVSDRDRNGTLTLTGTGTPAEPLIKTGDLRMVDLHDRRFLLYHQVVSTTGTGTPTYNLILSLEPFSPSRTAGSSPNQPYTFNSNATYLGTARPDNGSGNPGDLMNRQMASMSLHTTNDGTNDDSILYQITYNRHLQTATLGTTPSHWTPFLGLSEMDSITDTRYLRKGDMACLCLDYGKVSPKMMEFQVEKYWNYQQTVAANPTAAIDPELAEGQLLYLMGENYYNKMSTLLENTEAWTKTHAISWAAHGLSKLSPARNTDVSTTPVLVTTTTGSVTTTDVDLRYPRVDMSFQRAAWVGNGTAHLDSGDTGNLVNDNADELLIGGGSVNEHLVINEFFQQSAAVSTMKLLDIAQGHGGPVLLTAANYNSTGTTSFTASKTTTTGTVSHTLEYWCGWDTTVTSTIPPGSLWNSIKDTLSSTSTGSLSAVYVTPGPQTASGQSGSGQAYTGMGALTLGVGSYGAYITDNMVIDRGGYGGSIGYSVTPSFNIVNQSFVTPTSSGGYSFVNSGNISTSVPTFTPGTIAPINFGSLNAGISTSTQLLMPDQLGSLGSYMSQITSSTTSFLIPEQRPPLPLCKCSAPGGPAVLPTTVGWALPASLAE